MNTVVELESLELSLGGTDVLRGLDFEMSAGQVVAVTGKSGCGKSTLLNVVAGLEPPNSGQAKVFDNDLLAMDEGERTRLRRRRMGMVFQFFNLIPTLTVRENLTFPLELNNLETGEAPGRLLEELELEHRAERYPDTLSGGERQRTAIGRALVHGPDLLLADEPTGNLDHDRSRTVLSKFKRLCRERDVAVLLATHAEECASVADRRYNLRSGRLQSAS